MSVLGFVIKLLIWSLPILFIIAVIVAVFNVIKKIKDIFTK